MRPVGVLQSNSNRLPDDGRMTTPQPGYPTQPPYNDPSVTPQAPPPGTGQLPASDRSKVLAGLLGIFLGSFGVGRFYLGYTKVAVAQILVTWLTLGIGGIWPFIDGILILMGKVPDAQGRPLRD
jgi:TM2 domain-containing membrane protein YozV